MSFKSYFLRGISWTGISSLLNTGSNILLILILAKYFSASEMGSISIFLLVMSLLAMLSEFGLSSALIQKSKITTNHYTTIFYVNIIIGILIAVIFLYYADYVSILFLKLKDQELIKSLKFLSLNIVIVSVAQMYRTYLVKKLEFRTIAKIELISNVIFFTSNIIFIILLRLGIIGFVYSLIIKRLIELCFLVFKVKIPLDFKRIKLRYLKDFAYFGLSVTGDRLITFLANNLIVNVIIGRNFGGDALGQYNIAHRVLFQPQQLFTSVVARVTFPTFSYYQKDIKTLSNGYLKIIKYIAFVIFPINLLAFTIGPDLIHYFYGDKYLQCEEIIQIIAIFSAFKFIVTNVGPLIYSQGRADLSFIFNCINLFITYLVLEYSKSFGLIFTIWIWIFASILLSIIIQLIGNNLINLPIKKFIINLKVPIISLFYMIIGVLIYELFVAKNFVNNIIDEIIIGLITGLIFVIVAYQYDNEIKNLINRTFKIT